MRALSGCTCECARCEAPRNRDVLCSVVISVVIGVHCAFRPTCTICCPLCRPDSPCCDTVSVHPTLFP